MVSGIIYLKVAPFLGKDEGGMGGDESRILLEELLSSTTETNHIYAHTQKPDDLVN